MTAINKPGFDKIQEIAKALLEIGIRISIRELAIYRLHNPIDLSNLLAAGPKVVKRWFIQSEKLVSRKAERLRQRLDQLGLCPNWDDIYNPETSLDDFLRLPDPELKSQVEQIIARGYDD